MGDSASNIGRAGHNQRHQIVLRQLVLIMQGVWGTLVEMEPQDHLGYSNNYRRDVSGRGLGEARARGLSATSSSSKEPLSSNVEDIGRRGAFVGFGNTAPGTRGRGRTSSASRSGVKGTVALPPGVVATFRPAPAPVTPRTRSRTTPTRCRARTRTC